MDENKIVRKYTAIQIKTKKIDNERVDINLTYGEIEGAYYSTTHPQEEFDTEQEAIEYAYRKSKYANWLIIPIISFKNF